MDCRLEARLKKSVLQFSQEYQAELAAAGTLVELEELTCQIGDQLTRMLTEGELVRRGQEEGEPVECPDCGRACLPDAEPEPMVLAGLRGELAFTQPKHFCDRCRRSFFPDGRPLGHAAAKHRDNEGSSEGGVGRREQQQLPVGGRGAAATG